MAEQIVISKDEPFQSFDVILDGSSYTIALHWNERVDSWFMSLADATGSPIISGIRVVTGRPLLRDFVDVRLPRGQMLCVDTHGEDKDPGYDDFGEDSRCALLYLTEAEVAAS